jgi:hypothetical protein
MYHIITEKLFSDNVSMCCFSEIDIVSWGRFWRSFLECVMLQSLQTVLMSIEERLRALDTLYSPRFIPRWEVSIDQQSRRMETIESRLGRLETLLELRLDKLSEVIWLFYYVRKKEHTDVVVREQGTQNTWQSRIVSRGCSHTRAADFTEILRNIKLNIWIKSL